MRRLTPGENSSLCNLSVAPGLGCHTSRGCHDAGPIWGTLLRFNGLYHPCHVSKTLSSSMCPVPPVLIVFPILYQNFPEPQVQGLSYASTIWDPTICLLTSTCKLKHTSGHSKENTCEDLYLIFSWIGYFMLLQIPHCLEIQQFCYSYLSRPFSVLISFKGRQFSSCPTILFSRSSHMY